MSLLAVDCKATGIFLKKFAAQHKGARKGDFAWLPMVTGKMIGYYYGELVYSDLCRQKQLENTFEEVATAVTLEQLSKSALTISDTKLDERGVRQTTWIDPTPFCCMLYTKAARYLPGYGTIYMVKRSHSRQNNVSFAPFLSADNWSKL